MISELIYRLLHARTNAHILHLGTRSYAQHIALAEFYEAVGDFADRIAECYIGEHGEIDFTAKTAYRPCAEPLKLIEELKAWVEQHRYEAVEAEDTYVHNIIDEVVALCASTQYKLRFLK